MDLVLDSPNLCRAEPDGRILPGVDDEAGTPPQISPIVTSGARPALPNQSVGRSGGRHRRTRTRQGPPWWNPPATKASRVGSYLARVRRGG